MADQDLEAAPPESRSRVAEEVARLAAPPTDWRKHSIDSLIDATKQLITVATGVVTVTVVFSKDLDSSTRNWAYGSWALFFVSVCLGIFVLYNISGSLNNAVRENRNPSIDDTGIRGASAGQWLFFLLGIIPLMTFGCLSARAKPSPDQATSPVNINYVTSPPVQDKSVSLPPAPSPQMPKPVRPKRPTQPPKCECQID